MASAQRNTFVIGIGNQKGGVGKTSVTAHLAAALGERGLSVLGVDLDMNYGLTQHFGIEPEAFLGAFEVLVGEEDPEHVIITGPDDGIELPRGVHIIPSRRKLEEIDRALSEKNKFVVKHNALVKPLQKIRSLDRYDVILLDTAPNATTPTLAAYRSADWFLLTAMPDPFATRGLNDALQDIHDAQENGNPDLRLLGVVLSSVDKRTRLASTLSDYVEATFSASGSASLKFRTEITRSTVIPSAQKQGKTVFQTEATHKIADQYRALAGEVLERLFTVGAATNSLGGPGSSSEAANG